MRNRHRYTDVTTILYTYEIRKKLPYDFPCTLTLFIADYRVKTDSYRTLIAVIQANRSALENVLNQAEKNLEVQW
jgi:hypothetical protein